MHSNVPIDVIAALIANGASSTRIHPRALPIIRASTLLRPIAPPIPRLLQVNLSLELSPKALHQRNRPRQLRKRRD